MAKESALAAILRMTIGLSRMLPRNASLCSATTKTTPKCAQTALKAALLALHQLYAQAVAQSTSSSVTLAARNALLTTTAILSLGSANPAPMIATPATAGDTALPVHTDVLRFLASLITNPQSVSPVLQTAVPANPSTSALLAPMAPSWMQVVSA